MELTECQVENEDMYVMSGDVVSRNKGERWNIVEASRKNKSKYETKWAIDIEGDFNVVQSIESQVCFMCVFCCFSLF